jgi:hypothetical protein
MATANCTAFNRCTPRPASPSGELLTQIRTGYTARWNDLVLSVELDRQQWTAVVHDPKANRNLYSASRSNANAAKFAALDFALLQGLAGIATQAPEQIAHRLDWKHYW